MTLEEEVEINRKTIRTDGYPMSIGELSSLYKDNELKLRPDFQRYFRALKGSDAKYKDLAYVSAANKETNV
jgi:hypothetical protein